jgi:hypothetical protein
MTKFISVLPVNVHGEEHKKAVDIRVGAIEAIRNQQIAGVGDFYLIELPTVKARVTPKTYNEVIRPVLYSEASE